MICASISTDFGDTLDEAWPTLEFSQLIDA